MSYDQVLARFDALDREDVRTLPDGRDTTIIITGEIRWQEVKQLLLKEEWFFDKKHSTMQVRILGICPLRQFVETVQTSDDEDIGGELQWRQLFWVYYPHSRTVLANTAVFNEFNDAQRNSFDDIFFKRRFNSFIVKETNVYNNRNINEYTFGGIPNMQESERIKMELFNLEHDLWEY
jgi:gliding motility associated protien GldN